MKLNGNGIGEKSVECVTDRGQTPNTVLTILYYSSHYLYYNFYYSYYNSIPTIILIILIPISTLVHSYLYPYSITTSFFISSSSIFHQVSLTHCK